MPIYDEAPVGLKGGVIMSVRVNEKKCVGCGLCAMTCPREAIRTFGVSTIDSNKCSECYGGMSFLHDHSRNETPGRWLNQKEFWRKACMRNCPVKAIEEV